MSGNPGELMQIPIIIQVPENNLGGNGSQTVAELKQLLKELQEIIQTGFGPLSWNEEELADYFGISLKSLTQERLAGKIKYKRVKGKIHYSRRHVEDYLNSEGK